MIADRMENLGRYRGLGPNLDAAISWLESTPLDELQPGTIAVRDDEIRAIVQQYETVDPAGRQHEAHRKFTDIQCVLHGVERMLVTPLGGLAPAGDYDTTDDIVFFDTPAPAHAAACDMVVPAGHFAIFFPQDAHMPMLNADVPATVKKVVVKVAVDD